MENCHSMNRFGDVIISEVPEPVKTPAGCVSIDLPNPPSNYYHYSNEQSQGALICQTENFPDYYRKSKESMHTAYSDRMAQWDREQFEKACKLAGGGDGVWCDKLPSLKDTQLREFAQVALTLPVLPKHVRAVFYYNVSRGHPCPVIMAITDK